jgi:hypothetical protein
LVAWEGLAEQGCYRFLESVPTIWRYFEQPCRIPFVAEGGVESSYTPDVLIIFQPPSDPAWRIPPLLVEVKPVEILRTWWREHQAKLTSAMAFAWDLGWDFRVITDVEIKAGESALGDCFGANRVQQATALARPPILNLIDQWGELAWEEVVGRLPGFSEDQISKATCELISEGVLDLKSRRAPFVLCRLKWPVGLVHQPSHRRPE